MNRIELLAPVGSLEALKAAVQAGCDAVYLGYYAFGARSKASFDDDEIIEAIDYAHLYGVKVYITVNTIIYEDEFTELLEAIDTLIEYKADAFIVQDIGVLEYLKSNYKGIELHASTQMHIHNQEAAKLCKENGVSRFVAAREMSLEEIEKIKKNVDIEVEVFVHGALCVSYSGQCLMSSVSHQRSGNRGECAQNCRLKYDLVRDDVVIKEQAYLLSTKDLYNLKNVDKLIEAGVDSIKIEGRLKRPEYVYEVVLAYRNAIDAYYEKNDVDYELYEDRLLRIFNRQFTSGYLFKERNIVNSKSNSHVGVDIGRVVIAKGKKLTLRLTDSIHIGDGLRIGSTGYQVNNMYINNKLVKSARANEVVTLSFSFDVIQKKNATVLKTTDAKRLNEINVEIRNNLRKVNINAFAIFKGNQQMELHISDGVNEVKVKTDELVQEALKTPLDKERLEKQLSKFGSSIYNLAKFDIEFDEGQTIAIKAINELRRRAIEQLNQKRMGKTNMIEKTSEFEIIEMEKTNDIDVIVANEEQLRLCLKYNFDHIIVRDKKLLNSTNDNRVKYLNSRVNHSGIYLEDSFIGEIGGLKLNNILGSDSFFNVVNSKALKFLASYDVKKICLSEELSFRQIDNLLSSYHNQANVEVIIYNRKELMITKHCPISEVVKTSKGCNICEVTHYLQNDFKELYPLLKEGNCLTKVLNIKVNNDLDKIKHYKDIGVTNFKVIFTIESPSEVLNVLDDLKLVRKN